MKASVAGPIYAACEAALDAGASARSVFGHAGKAATIDSVWREREALFVEFGDTADVLAFCERLPFVGPITRYHLAKNLGGNFVKPDVHLAAWPQPKPSPPGSCAMPWHSLQGTGSNHRYGALAGVRGGAIDSRLAADAGHRFHVLAG